MLRGVAPALAVLVAACEFPSAGRLPCGPGGACADGNVCLDQLCVPEPASCAKAVSAGLEHTCAIRDDGTAWCWGRNEVGQLGDGSREDRTSPTKVATDTLFVAIDAGHDHTCAIADDKTVWCWGSNASGQLTSGALGLMPSQARELTGIKAITSGAAYSCALAENGDVSCWGLNHFGQLGNNSTQESDLPVRTLGGVVATALDASGDTTCAIAAGSQPSLYCWGENSSGQFADRSTVLHRMPVAVPGLDAAQVAVGEDSICALTSDGDVQCAGDISFGQLGNPLAVIGKFARVDLQVKASAIALGPHFGCATAERDGDYPQSAWCWGSNGFYQLSSSTNSVEGSPIRTDYENVAALSAGGQHLCALSATGGITCSGLNNRGQVGDGTRTTQSEPTVVIEGLAGVTSLAAGGAHSCAVTGGSVMCWGHNSFGQLGDGTTTRRSRPVRVAGVVGAVAVVAGGAHTCALLADRTAMCWGLNDDRQTGDGTSEFRSAPRPVVIDSSGTKLGSIVQLAAGALHTCAVLETPGGNTVACWGDNSQGQLGDGGLVDRNVAVPVAMLPAGVQEISLGFFHTCALNSGVVRCWGINGFGQLGNAAYGGGNSNLPIGVQNLGPALRISSHGDFTCAIVDEDQDRVWCWGSGGAGQMGNGGFQGFRQPEVPVNALSGATLIAGGGGHACALAGDRLQCWGASNFGQVGNGRYESRPAPAPISLPGDASVSALVAGDQHTCALLDGGTVTCWGDGRSGQLGDGALDRISRTAPLLPCP
jgi:alpha-tubulin suppressor-like RCC1 family protein